MLKLPDEIGSGFIGIQAYHRQILCDPAT
jgi:hypothetical protein